MISIALCTYNGEKFLREQLDSIERQTRMPDELIVCDDRSADSTMDILREFLERVPFPVHIHQNEINLGSTKNFEKAISLCTGDIIVLCDQDDIWRKDKLEKVHEAFKNHPEADYVFSDGDLVGDDLTPLHSTLWEAVEFSGEIYSRYVAGDQLFGFFRRQFVTGATMAFRERLRNYILPFPESPLWIHDGWIALVGSAIGRGGIPLAEPLIRYRQHQGQLIGAVVSETPKSLFREFVQLKNNRSYFVNEWTTFAEIFPVLLARLKEKGLRNEADFLRKVAELEGFQVFFLNRRRVFSSGFLHKVGLTSRELITGRYKKFANSWKSAIADLLL